MPRFLTLRPLTDEEARAVDRLAHSRTAPARAVERAQIVWRAHQGARVPRWPAAVGSRVGDRKGQGLTSEELSWR